MLLSKVGLWAPAKGGPLRAGSEPLLGQSPGLTQMETLSPRLPPWPWRCKCPRGWVLHENSGTTLGGKQPTRRASLCHPPWWALLVLPHPPGPHTGWRDTSPASLPLLLIEKAAAITCAGTAGGPGVPTSFLAPRRTAGRGWCRPSSAPAGILHRAWNILL